MPLQAELALLAWNGWIYRHALAALGNSGKLVPKYERVHQFCIADTLFGKPMQVGTADAHR